MEHNYIIIFCQVILNIICGSTDPDLSLIHIRSNVTRSQKLLYRTHSNHRYSIDGHVYYIIIFGMMQKFNHCVTFCN